MADAICTLRAHKRVKYASYDVHYKRIRVGVHGSNKPLYKNVRRAHTLLEEEDKDGMEEFLADTVDTIIASLGEDPCEPDDAPLVDAQDGFGDDGVADQDLHAPGDEVAPLVDPANAAVAVQDAVAVAVNIGAAPGETSASGHEPGHAHDA